MILLINTKDRNLIKVSLKKDGRIINSLSEENKHGSQVLLPLVNKILKTKNLKPEDLTGIEVEKGPGSFVGLRVGVSVANAFGFALKIPVNGKKTETDLLY